ncbi:unnamed protein product [Effrenium voratum]|nr:unnamed protein product [Effrenium voratum]
MDAEESELQQLQEQEKKCIEALRPSIGTFVELSIFCGANAMMEKLEAVLGERHAASLGVAAGGREMRVEAVCKAVKEAFQIRAYGKGLQEGESAWSHLRPLVFGGRKFYEKNMLELREAMVKFRGESLEKKRRHAFMAAGTLLHEYSSDHAFQRDLRGRLGKLFEEGLNEALRNNLDFVTVKSILVAARNMQLGDFSAPVSLWLKQRLSSSLRSQQPVQTVVELVQSAKDFPGLDGVAIVKPLVPQIVDKCQRAILSQQLSAANVNQVGLFAKILGSAFDQALFESLKPSYEKHRAMLTEWLVAYTEHTGAELPPYCMNANQKEAFDLLRQAIEAGDVEQLKRAAIEAKTVPDLKSHEELCQEFIRALDILKEQAHMPPGWDLEDLLGTEKMFRKKPVNGERALQLFQVLMTSTHQKRWTRDRATRGDGKKIADAFEVARVTEVQNQASWENYHRRREEIVRECNPPDREPYAPLSPDQWQEWSGRVMTDDIGNEIASACRLSPLDPRCNEFLFFHGVKPQVADLIAENHFDISFASKDGMFGAGLYFAEASSKSEARSERITQFLSHDDAKVREAAICALNVISLETRGKKDVLEHSLEAIARIIHSESETTYLHETCVQLCRCASELPAFRFAFARHVLKSIWLLEKVYGTCALAAISTLLGPQEEMETRLQAASVAEHFLTSSEHLGDDIRVPPVCPLSHVEQPPSFAFEECVDILQHLVELSPSSESAQGCLKALCSRERPRQELAKLVRCQLLVVPESQQSLVQSLTAEASQS